MKYLNPNLLAKKNDYELLELALKQLKWLKDKDVKERYKAGSIETIEEYLEYLLYRLNGYNRDKKLIKRKDIIIDPRRKLVTRGGGRVKLSAQLYKVLLMLVLGNGTVYTRYQITNRSARLPDNGSGAGDTLIFRLREKLSQHGDFEVITTRYKMGYALSDRYVVNEGYESKDNFDNWEE